MRSDQDVMVERKKYIWLTDTHLNLLWPVSLRRLVRNIKQEDPTGIFLTGDISNGKLIEAHLGFLAKELTCEIYFVLGNHDYHARTTESVHADVRRLCARHPNLHWMSESGVISLNADTAVVGTGGWYDVFYGDPRWIRYTLDWILTVDFFLMPNMQARLDRFRAMARESAARLSSDLERALETHKVVYILTHFPPWKEATRHEGTVLEQFWLPYNTNSVMGTAIERVMEGHEGQRAIVLAGHTHEDCWITVGSNIECRVNGASYSGFPRNEQKVFL